MPMYARTGSTPELAGPHTHEIILHQGFNVHDSPGLVLC